MNDHIAPPSMLLRMLEGRAGIEASQLMLQLPLLRLQAKRGQGEPIIVLPGFMADDNSTVVLRSFLNSIGYKSVGWGLGINRKPMLSLLPQLQSLLDQVVTKHGQKVRLVGWSRGGILSRELARDTPEKVARVITIGSPVKGGTGASSIGPMVQRTTGVSSTAMSALLRERQKADIKVPVRAIYSKLDGVVNWQACIDELSPDIEHHEIFGSHVGMGTNVDVFRLLPKLLKDNG
jgi:triacylglycerol esterase/lipase EstA (alpha/beta hydrolase family)